MRNRFLIISILFLLAGFTKGQTCQVGDMVSCKDGSKGIIFWVNREGTGGWIVALEDKGPSAWGPHDIFGMDERTDWLDTCGYANTMGIRRRLGERKEYAAFLVDFEQGWYLPAREQLIELMGVKKRINPTLVAYGGQALVEGGLYWSSSWGSMHAYVVEGSEQGLYVGLSFGIEVGLVRAVRSFDIRDLLPQVAVGYQWNTGEETAAIGVHPLESTDYTVTVTTESGCSATVSQKIWVATREETVIYDTIRRGERYEKNGFSVTEPGKYWHVLRGEGGCETGIVLKLTVLEPLPPLVFNEYTCVGVPYCGHNFTAEQEGTYVQNWISTEGRDSVVILNLTVLPLRDTLIEASICEGEVYDSNGFQVSVAGRYKQEYTSSLGCDSIWYLNLKVFAGFQGKIGWETEDCTKHRYAFFTLPALSGKEDCWWDFGNGDIQRGMKPVYVYPDTGTYLIRMQLKTEDKCFSQSEAWITVPYYPDELIVESDYSFVSAQRDQVELWTNFFPDISYIWDFGDGQQGEGYKTKHRYELGKKEYYDVVLKATNIENCWVERIFRIEVKQMSSLPNTFSPNGDGINDIFMPGCRVKVIDRNGVVVYEGTNGWNGNVKEGEAAPGVYFYVVEYLKRGRLETQSGYITLLR